MNSYNQLIKKYIMLNIKPPTKQQYYKNTYYYNNKEKIKENRIRKKLLKKYGYFVYNSKYGFFIYGNNNEIIKT